VAVSLVEKTGQYRAVGWNTDWELKIHALDENGRTICGNNPKEYTRDGKTYEMRLTTFLFPKEVTCGACLGHLEARKRRAK